MASTAERAKTAATIRNNRAASAAATPLTALLQTLRYFAPRNVTTHARICYPRNDTTVTCGECRQRMSYPNLPSAMPLIRHCLLLKAQRQAPGCRT
jgi:hypothetical protein